MKSILNIQVSAFANVNSPDNPRTVNLLTWLTSDKYRGKVEAIRKESDSEKVKQLKKQLPAITPSGLFSYRDIEHLIKHTGFVAFDIDFKDNTHISNYSELKFQIKNIKNVAYCGLSVSGRGFWGLILISNPEKHKEHFQALYEDFKRFNINLDPSGKDVPRLRIYSFDPEAYFNHNAKTYTKIFKPKPLPAPKYPSPQTGDNRDKVEKILSELQGIDITGDYSQWFAIGCSLANEFGEGGRGYFHTVSKYYPGYSPNDTDKQFSHCLKHSYSYDIATFFYHADSHGIKFFDKTPKPQPVKLLSKSELNELALKNIGEFNHKSKDELLTLMGFSKLTQLINSEFITELKNLPGNYYLHNSTPF